PGRPAMSPVLRLPDRDPAELTVPALLLRNEEDHGDLPALSWRAQGGRAEAGTEGPGEGADGAGAGTGSGPGTAAEPGAGAGDGGWSTLTWAQVRERVARLAAGFAALGVRRGEKVLMMMGNRPEHLLADLALVHLGAVPVSVYGTAAPEQIAYIVRHSGARLAVVEGADEVRRWRPHME